MEPKLKRKPGRPRKYLPIDESAFEDDTEEQRHTREVAYAWRVKNREAYLAYQREYHAKWVEENKKKQAELSHDSYERKKLHRLIEENEQAKEDVQ